MDKISDKTYVSLAVLISIMTAVWYVAGIAKQTEINTENIREQDRVIAELPTRDEFDTLKEGIKTIQDDVKKLLEAKSIK